MLTQVTLLLVGVVLVSAQYGHAPAPAPVNPYQHAIVNSISQDTVGNFGYATADGQSRTQQVAPDGSVRGRYSYIDANGKPVTVNYVADKFGYRAAGDNVPAHAQHVPQPQPPTYQQPSYQPPPPAPIAPSFPHSPSFPPAQPAFPAPAHNPYAYQPPAVAAQPPPHHHNPAAEQQLVHTITAHQQSDQRAQAAQLQQLDAITRQNPAFTGRAAVAAPQPYPYGGPWGRR